MFRFQNIKAIPKYIIPFVDPARTMGPRGANAAQNFTLTLAGIWQCMYGNPVQQIANLV